MNEGIITSKGKAKRGKWGEFIRKREGKR